MFSFFQYSTQTGGQTNRGCIMEHEPKQKFAMLSQQHNLELDAKNPEPKP